MKFLPVVEKSLVIFLFLFVFGVLYFLLDPFKALAARRNERRWSDVNTIADQILLAVSTSTVSAIPLGVTIYEQQIGTAVDGCAVGNQACNIVAPNCTDIHNLAGQKTTLPSDIRSGSMQRTGYSVLVNREGELVVKACRSESSALIEVRRALPASGLSLIHI